MQIPFLCEKSGVIALVLLGLMAGWLAGRQVGWPADKIVVNLIFFKITYVYTG